jgi:hypothetical protein
MISINLCVRADYGRFWQRQARRLKPGLLFNWQWSRNGEPVANSNLRSDADRMIAGLSASGSWRRMAGHELPGTRIVDTLHLRRATCMVALPGGRLWSARCCAVLYGDKIYACRHCHRLAYRTQREQAHDRAGSKADKLRNRLGWEAGILNGNGGKPKGMHWTTFSRLEAEHDSLAGESDSCRDDGKVWRSC